MFNIHVYMALLALIFFPISFFLSFLFKKWKKSVYKNAAEAEDHFYSCVNHCLNFLIEIKGLNQQNSICNSFNPVVTNVKNADNRKTITDYTISFTDNLVQNIFSFFIISFAAHYIFKGTLSIGVLLSFNIYTARLFSSISTIKELQLAKQPLRIALDRIRYLTTFQFNGKRHCLADEGHFSSINIRNIHFQYKNNIEILKGLSLEIKAPGFYSIIGKNGCGKTTLLKLIDSIYKPQQGSIFLDDFDYENFCEDDIRTQITFVTKNCFIVHDTLLENIKMYHSNTLIEVQQVCKLVGFDNYIQRLPDGLNTVINPENNDFSSGMKQRLNVARILLNPSPIILLDEITSDLDGGAERLLISNLVKLGEKSIIISISHRLEAVRNSKQIYLLDEGKIIESGTFSSMQKNSKEFRELFVYK